MPQTSRRDFLKIMKDTFLGGIYLAMGGLGYGTLIEPSWLAVTDLHLKLPRLAKSFDGFKLAQISDIHIGGSMTINMMENVVERLLEFNFDAVVITGDFVWGYLPGFQPDLQGLGLVLAKISSVTPAFAVMGNHDHWLDVEAVRRMLGTAGIMELENTVHTFFRGDEQLYLCGVGDVYERQDNLQSVLEKLPESGCAILLAHEPDFADQSACTHRFDLQLSGHSHGGQIVLPGYGPLVLPHLAQKYPLGLYQVEEMFQYTNRGLGMGGLRIRFNCRPEITVFTLEST